MKNGIVDKLSTYAALIGVIDISGIAKNTGEIAKSNERISLLEKSDKERPDVSGIAKNEKQVAINQKEIEVLKLQIQELKLKSTNPLSN